MSTIDSEETQDSGKNNDRLAEFYVSWQTPDGETEEGPLSVLWGLIESYRVDIFEISIHQITEDFLSFLKMARDLQVELASSFAVMAARLLYYKSKSLLPDPGFEEPESEDRLPPELVEQLLEYRRFQMAAEKLQHLDEVAAGLLPRKSSLVSSDSETWLDVSLVDLVRAYGRVLEKLDPAPEPTYDIPEAEFSVEEKMDEIRSILERSSSFSFFELFEDLTLNRSEVIATFLAILELVKGREIILQQKTTFEDIYIFKKTITVS